MSLGNWQPIRIERNRSGRAEVYTVGRTDGGVGQNLRLRPSKALSPLGILVPGGVKSWKARFRTFRSNSLVVFCPMSLIARWRGVSGGPLSDSSSDCGRFDRWVWSWCPLACWRTSIAACRRLSFAAFLCRAALLCRPPDRRNGWFSRWETAPCCSLGMVACWCLFGGPWALDPAGRIPMACWRSRFVSGGIWTDPPF